MTAGQYIDYEALAQEAMRGIIRAVLAQVAKSGGTLYGDHHFYIAFNTQAPGVILSKRLREKYPLEMTIVLQHRFWDLEVGEERFEVKLTFDGIPERLAIPYKAVKVFYDPSVPYGLQFEESELAQRAVRGSPMRETGPDDAAASGDRGRLVGLQSAGERAEPRTERPPRRPRAVKNDTREDRAGSKGSGQSEPAEQPSAPAVAERATPRVSPSQPSADSDEGKSAHARPTLVESKPDEPSGVSSGETGASKVVDLSKFRKK